MSGQGVTRAMGEGTNSAFWYRMILGTALLGLAYRLAEVAYSVPTVESHWYHYAPSGLLGGIGALLVIPPSAWAALRSVIRRKQ